MLQNKTYLITVSLFLLINLVSLSSFFLSMLFIKRLMSCFVLTNVFFCLVVHLHFYSFYLVHVVYALTCMRTSSPILFYYSLTKSTRLGAPSKRFRYGNWYLYWQSLLVLALAIRGVLYQHYWIFRQYQTDIIEYITY